MKLVLWNITVPMVIGFIRLPQLIVTLSTLPGYIPVSIFLQEATPKRYPKQYYMDFVEASQAPQETERF